MEGALVGSLEGHEMRVWHVAWSPDGKLLATCGADRVIRVWSAGERFDCVATLEDVQSRTIRCCEWSPCGSYLAAGSFDASTVIWQRGRKHDQEGECWECVATLEGHENEVKSVAFSHDQKYLATCSRDKTVWIWESPPQAKPSDYLPDEEIECETVSVLQGHTQDVKFVTWHPSELILFSASYDDTIRVWAEDVEDWITVSLLQGHQNTVWGVVLSPDGNTVASVSQDLSLRLWNRDPQGVYVAGKVLDKRHGRPIFSVDWSTDNQYIATCAGDDSIIVQSTAQDSDCRVLCKIEKAHTEDVNCVRFSPVSSNMFASASDDCSVKVWRMS